MNAAILIGLVALLAIALPAVADAQPDTPQPNGPPQSCVTLMLGQSPPVIVDPAACLDYGKP